MPSVFGDGSVRNISYTSGGTANGVSLTAAQVFQMLWAFNDGFALSQSN